MSSMGPTPPSDKEVNDATESVLEHLRKKYRAFDAKNPSLPHYNDNRLLEKENLRQVIKSILFHRNCEEF